MPPVHRWHRGRVRVPGNLPDCVRGALDLHVENDDWGDYEDSDELSTATWLNRLRPLRRYQTGFILVDAEVLSELRNRMDLEALNSECQCAGYGTVGIQDGGLDPDCTWCQCLLARDRCDYWLDQAPAVDRPGTAAGITGRKNAWIGKIGYDIEAWFIPVGSLDRTREEGLRRRRADQARLFAPDEIREVACA